MIAELIVQPITNFIGNIGYFGIFILMILESLVFPIPSEAIMPFAGFLIAEGKFSFFWVIISSTLGSITGSLVAYFIGYYGGEPIIRKYGKYVLITEKELGFTEGFFKNKGNITIFVSRLIPVVRHLISIPAGMAKMNIFKFSFYTIIGAGIWNSFLAILGFYLKKNWTTILEYTKILDIVIIVLLVFGIGFFIYNHLKK